MACSEAHWNIDVPGIRTSDLSRLSCRSICMYHSLTVEVHAASTDSPSTVLPARMARWSCVSSAYWWYCTPCSTIMSFTGQSTAGQKRYQYGSLKDANVEVDSRWLMVAELDRLWPSTEVRHQPGLCHSCHPVAPVCKRSSSVSWAGMCWKNHYQVPSCSS